MTPYDPTPALIALGECLQRYPQLRDCTGIHWNGNTTSAAVHIGGHPRGILHAVVDWHDRLTDPTLSASTSGGYVRLTVRGRIGDQPVEAFAYLGEHRIDATAAVCRWLGWDWAAEPGDTRAIGTLRALADDTEPTESTRPNATAKGAA